MANNRPQNPPFTILDIPPELKEPYVYPHLLPTIMSLFARTCRQAEQESRLLRLLQYAVNALPVSYNQEDKSKLAALEMLKSYPDLLFEEKELKDLTGQWHYGSAYKMFLRSGNIAALNEVHEKIIPRIPEGEAFAKEQYVQQFPRHAEAEGKVYDDRNIAQIAQVKEDLKEIVAAISEDLCTGCKATEQRTKDAIARLKAHLAPKGDVIRTGLLSPPEILKIIHDVYDQNYDPWTIDQLSLYSCEVIGAAEAVAAPHHAQCYKKGLSNINDNTLPDRTVSYYLPGSGVGVPPDLGVSSFIDVYYGGKGSAAQGGMRKLGGWHAYWLPACAFLENYVERQNQHLVQFTQRWTNPAQNAEHERSLNMTV